MRQTDASSTSRRGRLGPGDRDALSSKSMLRVLACIVTASVAAGAAAAGAPGRPVACEPTIGDAEGPFEQSLLDTPLRAKIGTGHVLQGRIVRAGDCSPVAQARVFLWQAGRNGYGPRGRGSVRTDRRGRFRFEGPVPVSYDGRPPHIHIAVLHPAYEDLLTRYVVRRGTKTGRMRIVLTPLL